jgi:hypothetical protein
MGVAFGSSLLGLAGSLVVGLLELFAGHGQNRFYQELEDWLSSITRVGFTTGDDATTEQNIMAGVVDHMAEQMEGLQQLFSQAEANRTETDGKLASLAGSVERLMERMENGNGSTDGLDRIADGQERMIAALEKRADDGIDAESRMRLRSIDVQMLRILEEISAGRQETMAELRHDISLLAKALSGGRSPLPGARRMRTPDKPDDGER